MALSVTPSSQTVGVGSPATISVQDGAGSLGDTFDDAGGGGVFTPSSGPINPGGPPGYTFTYSNASPGTYTITVTPGYSDLPVSVTVIVASSTITVALTGQAVAVGQGSALTQPMITLLGQQCHAAQSYLAGPSDEVLILSGQACAAAAGSISGAQTAALVGQSVNVLSSALSSGPDKFANLSGQSVHTAIECYKNVKAVTGPNEVTYTLFDMAGSHDIPGPNGTQTVLTLTFSLADVTMNAGDIATMDGLANTGRFRFYAFGPNDALIGVGYDTFSLSQPGTDLDGLSTPFIPPPNKTWELEQPFPLGIFTWDGHFTGQILPGPYEYDIGNYLNFSKLVFDNQGGTLSLSITAQISGSLTCRLYCAYIKIIVSTSNPKSVLLQADTYDGALNVIWVSGGPPGKLKHAVHLGPQLHIGASTVGWQTTQVIESTDSCTACGLVYLPEGRLYINYQGAGSAYQRYNDRRGTGDVANWSARQPADRNHISAGGRGQEQAWRFIAGAADSADHILFSQCRDGRGEGWTSVTSTIKAVDSIARGPLCGGCWMGNQYGLLYTRNSDGEVFFKTAANPSPAPPSTWTSTPIDTGFTGNVCGLAMLPSGRLVGLTQASAGGAVKALISNDQGATWTRVNLSITPTPPPVIVSIESTLFAVYIQSDAPRFAASVDGGATWA